MSKKNQSLTNQSLPSLPIVGQKIIICAITDLRTALVLKLLSGPQ